MKKSASNKIILSVKVSLRLLCKVGFIICNLSKKFLQKLDKGNSVVVFDKDLYIKHIKSLLSDKAKFEKVGTKKGLPNFTLNHEKRINEHLKSLKSSGAVNVEWCKKIKTAGSRPGILYMFFVKYLKI